MKTKTKTQSTKKIAAAKLKYAIIANEKYGLYAGYVESFDTKTRVAIVRECRHVAWWYGRTGGITSLAAHGLCGPKAGESRIGAPCRAQLTGVVNVFECSAEAQRTIESAVQS